MNTQQRIDAINKLAADTGQPRATLLAKVANTWQLNIRERFELEQEIRNAPTPADLAAAQLAKSQLAKAEAVGRAEQRIQDLRVWRAYEAADPFTRARIREADEASLQRGRALSGDDDPEPGPMAA